MELTSLSSVKGVLTGLTDIAVLPLNALKAAVEEAKLIVEAALQTAQNVLDTAKLVVGQHCDSARTALADKQAMCNTQAQGAGQAGEVVVRASQESPGVKLSAILEDGGSDTVLDGVPFVPEVLFKDQWYPICGHSFLDNNYGAMTVCRLFGFSGGTHSEWNKGDMGLNTSAMPVGTCGWGEKLKGCTGGGNDWRPNLRPDTWPENCQAGKNIGVIVTCTGREGDVRAAGSGIGSCTGSPCVGSSANPSTLIDVDSHVKFLVEPPSDALTTSTPASDANTLTEVHKVISETPDQSSPDAESIVPTVAEDMQHNGTYVSSPPLCNLTLDGAPLLPTPPSHLRLVSIRASLFGLILIELYVASQRIESFLSYCRPRLWNTPRRTPQRLNLC